MTVIKNKLKKMFNSIKLAVTDEKNEPAQTATDDGDTFHTFITPAKEKIKHYFSKKQTELKQLPKENPPEEDFNIDFSIVKNFCTKYSATILLAIILILQFVPNEGYLPWGGLWMRLQTQNLPLLDEFAQNSVYNFYRNQVANQIVQQYPTLPDEQKGALVEEQLQKVVNQNQAVVDEQVRQTADYLKDFMQYEQNGTKYTMMPDIDPYQFLRLARNYADHGSLGDELKNGVWWDTKIIAPFGRASDAINHEFHPYILAYLHKIITFFRPTLPIMETASYFPIIFVTLAVAFTFLFVNRINNKTGAIISATFIAIASAAVGRTQWGHADTDAYNLFFPMLICWLFAEALETEKPLKKYSLITLIGLFFGVYAFAWMGWWYLFDFILAGLIINTIYSFIFNRTKITTSLVTTIVYFLSTGIFTAIFKKDIFTIINTAFVGPFGFTIIKDAVHTETNEQLFPNVYTTVAELNPTSWFGAIDSMGGTLILTTCVIGLILLFFNKTIKRQNRTTYATILALWVVATLYATTKGIRFAILTVPTTAILFGICAGVIEQKIQQYNKQKLRLKTVFITIAIILTFGFMIMQTGEVEQSYTQSKNDLPIMNKAWWNALTAIKEDSKPNAIINSWWDFGHHFKYVADRAVTFDGAHQNSPMAHWIGKVLVTDNEEEAVALLRMLDCGSRQGYEELFFQLDNNTMKAMKLFRQLIMIKNKEEAKKLLTKNNIQNPENVLSLTHCEPPENYFITSEDMVQKAGVWSHFGLWNFEKAYAWINIKNKPKDAAIKEMTEKLSYNQQQAEQTYTEILSLKDEGAANSWVSPWSGYISGFDGCNEQNNMIICGNGARINKTNMETFVSVEQGTAKPRYLSYIDEKTKKFSVKEFNDAQVNMAVILVPTGEKTYRSVLASTEHAKSMFTRLFYMEGHGLKYFKPFRTEHQIVGGGKISIWKIDWDGKETNVIEPLKNR